MARLTPISVVPRFLQGHFQWQRLHRCQPRYFASCATFKLHWPHSISPYFRTVSVHFAFRASASATAPASAILPVGANSSTPFSYFTVKTPDKLNTRATVHRGLERLDPPTPRSAVYCSQQDRYQKPVPQCRRSDYPSSCSTCRFREVLNC